MIVDRYCNRKGRIICDIFIYEDICYSYVQWCFESYTIDSFELKDLSLKKKKTTNCFPKHAGVRSCSARCTPTWTTWQLPMLFREKMLHSIDWIASVGKSTQWWHLWLLKIWPPGPGSVSRPKNDIVRFCKSGNLVWWCIWFHVALMTQQKEFLAHSWLGWCLQMDCNSFADQQTSTLWVLWCKIINYNSIHPSSDLVILFWKSVSSLLHNWRAGNAKCCESFFLLSFFG